MPEKVPLEAHEQPFKIRAHHLGSLATTFSVSPEEAIDAFIQKGYLYLKGPGGQRYAQGDVERELQIDPNFVHTDLYYFFDVLGENRAQTETHRAGFLDFVKQYQSLPDGHPVMLGNFKDGICTSCAIGQHCTVEDNDEEEIAVLKIFKDICTDAGIEYELYNPKDTLPQGDEGACYTTARAVREFVSIFVQVNSSQSEHGWGHALAYFEEKGHARGWLKQYAPFVQLSKS